jgi:hypothetical protein
VSPAPSEQLALVGVVPRLASEAMTTIVDPAGALCVVVREIDVANVLSAKFEPSAAGEPIITGIGVGVGEAVGVGDADGVGDGLFEGVAVAVADVVGDGEGVLTGV